MGWLELLPLLKRLLPLLTRVAPVLEGFVAARGTVREDLQASLNDFKTQLSHEAAASGASYRELTDALTAHTERLSYVSSDLTRLRTAAEEQGTRLSAAELQLARLNRLVQVAMVLLGVLILLCVFLIYFVVSRHA